MEAILKFNLPEEQEEFEYAVNGSKWASLVWNLDQELRSKIKYSENITEEQENVYREVKSMLYELMSEKNLTLE